MRHAIAGLIAAGAITGAHAQTLAPTWIGTWDLDVSKSEYRAGAVPRRETITIVPYIGAYKMTIVLTDAGGRTWQTEAITKFDGADVLAIGLRVPTMRAFTIIDDHTFEMVDKVDGQVKLRSRASVSPDLRTLTLTMLGVDDGGQTVDAVLHFVVGAGSGSRLGPPPADQAPPPGVVRSGPGVMLPRILKQVRPQYTADAMRAKIQGPVLLECVVRTDGTVGDVRVVRSLDATYGLDQEAIKAAKQWVFAPGTRNGEPVPVMVSIELSFVMGKD